MGDKGNRRVRTESLDEMMADLVRKHGPEIAAVVAHTISDPPPPRKFFVAERSDVTKIRTRQTLPARVIKRAKA